MDPHYSINIIVNTESIANNIGRLRPAYYEKLLFRAPRISVECTYICVTQRAYSFITDMKLQINFVSSSTLGNE